MRNELERLEAEVKKLKDEVLSEMNLASELAAEMLNARADLAAANAIIEKLPLTADNVRVVPGMELWCLQWSGRISFPSKRVWVGDIRRDNHSRMHTQSNECYSTPEAAKEAADAK